MKFDRFYSKNKNKDFYLLALELALKVEKDDFLNDIFCNQCLKAELYPRKGTKQLHLAKKPSSTHEKWCIHYEENPEIDDCDMKNIKVSNISKTLHELFSLKKLEYFLKKEKLKKLNQELLFNFNGITKKLIPKELDENYTVLPEAIGKTLICFGEIFLIKKATNDNYYDLYTINNLNKKYVMGLRVNKKIGDIDINSKKSIFFICKGKIEENIFKEKTYYNIKIQKREDFEILEN